MSVIGVVSLEASEPLVPPVLGHATLWVTSAHLHRNLGDVQNGMEGRNGRVESVIQVDIGTRATQRRRCRRL